MNIKDLHSPEKPVSAYSFFKSGTSVATAIQILKGEKLKEHVTQVEALLVCISGKVVYESAGNEKVTLMAGDYVNIAPLVKHQVEAIEESQLLLLK